MNNGKPAVRLWTSMLGPQKGVYKGIYPTKEQAKELMTKSSMVSVSKTDEKFYINYQDSIMALLPNDFDRQYLDHTRETKAFVLNNECILLQAKLDTVQQAILLIDKSNGKIFARYCFIDDIHTK